MRWLSLTGRLIVVLTVGAAVLWLGAALLTMETLSSRLDAAFDGGLQETAERLLPLAIDSLHEHRSRESRELPLLDPAGGEYIVYQVRDGDGRVLLRSHDAPVAAFSVPLLPGISTSDGWRIYTTGLPDDGFYIQVGEALSHRHDALWSSAITLLLPITLFIPLSAFGIWFAVRSGLAPLRRLGDEVSRRHAANLSPIDTAGLPRELVPIADAIQALIGRLRVAFTAERAFAANSAHELRTPIAGSLAQTQRLIEELDGSPLKGRAQQIEESLRRLKQLGEKLMELSRADAGMAAVAEPVDLLPALRILVEDARRRAGGGERISLDAGAGMLSAPIDIDAFGIVLRNLLDNAILHGAADEPIVVRVIDEGAIDVVNGGPPIAPERLATLRHRFVRGDTSAAGSGLGLAIVETILTQVGGALELISPAPGRTDGFCARARLRLPGTPA